MAKVTYTKAQLMSFTVKEMKTLSLFSKIDPKGLSKEGIVNALMSAQKAEQKAKKKAKPAIKKETPPKAEKPTVETEAKVKEVKEEPVNAKAEAPKSEKPVFHRRRKSYNRMTYR